jgi:hypothetical protein
MANMVAFSALMKTVFIKTLKFPVGCDVSKGTKNENLNLDPYDLRL